MSALPLGRSYSLPADTRVLHVDSPTSTVLVSLKSAFRWLGGVETARFRAAASQGGPPFNLNLSYVTPRYASPPADQSDNPRSCAGLLAGTGLSLVGLSRPSRSDHGPCCLWERLPGRSSTPSPARRGPLRCGFLRSTCARGHVSTVA